MSCLDLKAIPQLLLPLAQLRKIMFNVVKILSTYLFISKQSADECFDLHQLVHLAIQN